MVVDAVADTPPSSGSELLHPPPAPSPVPEPPQPPPVISLEKKVPDPETPKPAEARTNGMNMNRTSTESAPQPGPQLASSPALTIGTTQDAPLLAPVGEASPKLEDDNHDREQSPKPSSIPDSAGKLVGTSLEPPLDAAAVNRDSNTSSAPGVPDKGTSAGGAEGLKGETQPDVSDTQGITLPPQLAGSPPPSERSSSAASEGDSSSNSSRGSSGGGGNSAGGGEISSNASVVVVKDAGGHDSGAVAEQGSSGMIAHPDDQKAEGTVRCQRFSPAGCSVVAGQVRCLTRLECGFSS